MKARRAAAPTRSAAPPLAVRDGQLTKEALMRVGLRLYKRVGYEATSLRMITEELGITVAATYYYFRSKDELLVAAFKRSLENLQMAHDSVSAELSARERLWTFVHLHTRMQRAESVTDRQPYGASQLITSVPADTAAPLIELMRNMRDRLRSIIAAGVRDKSFDKVDPTATTYAIFGMSQQINYWYQPNESLDMNKLSTMYADFALRIVGADPIRNRAQLLSLTASVTLDENIT